METSSVSQKNYSKQESDKPKQLYKNVLLVDDDRSVLRLGGEFLRKLGFSPVCVLSGSAAIRMAMDDDEAVELMILDVMLEDTTAFDVYEQVRRQKPDLPIVFVSGLCSHETLTNTLTRDKRTAFLPKPFSMDELAEAVSTV